MKTPQGLQYAAEGTGISSPLSEHVNLLGMLLGQVISDQYGPEMLELVETFRQKCKRAASENDEALRREVQEKIRDLDLNTIILLLKSYTDFFHLVNKAEQQEIIRINRKRAIASTPDHPRTESIAEAVHTLKEQGVSREAVLALIQHLDIQPTLTAHPTEARRRSVMYKQKRIATLLSEMRQRDLTPDEESSALEEIRRQIALLSVTDEVRDKRLSVQEEVDNGLFFLRNTIWETLPRIYEDVRRNLTRYYDLEVDLPVFLRFRSWIGSDRDGNPYVTPAVTRQTAITHRRTALTLFMDDLKDLRRELSFSKRKVETSKELLASIERDDEDLIMPGHHVQQFRYEPYRQKVSFMILRIESVLEELDEAFDGVHRKSQVYNTREFIEDLELVRDSLVQSGFGDIAQHGMLNQILVKARAFGFYMAALDVRQHSRVHEQAVAVLLERAGVTDRYLEQEEADRLAVLSAELSNPRPLQAYNADLPAPTREVLDTLIAIRDILDQEPNAVGSYIISMTHSVSDLLEVMLLAKEVGLWKVEKGVVRFPLDLVPLFETIEDLENAAGLMRDIFGNDLYRKQLAARGNFQEIMLGYSDSNKDGGFWMANWALHKGQATLGHVCRDFGIDFRLFHGRGGTVGRGGGSANKAIMAMPSVSHSGRIRFTEQGEVISFRYALPDIAHRHLEQIVNAMLLASHPPADKVEHTTLEEPEGALMESLAGRSMETYRALIENPDLWTWYTYITPIAQISRLPIASRPVSRKSADEVDFDSLRAIPWGFAWTQTRYMIPGWYGTGTALAEAIDQDEKNLNLLREAYASWNFFRTVLNNAQLEMARARFAIAQHYSRLTPGGGQGPPLSFHETILRDFEAASGAIVQITGQQEVFDYNPVIRKSIALRNPYTDVLNLLQIELLERHRASTSGDEEQLRRALFLSINGIAAAMQSTG